jgi:TnpA family transposase
MSEKKIIQKCPWQTQENCIKKFILCDDEQEQNKLFQKIFTQMNKDSNHDNFWTEIYETIIEYRILKQKHEHLLKEFSKLDDENERLNSLLE